METTTNKLGKTRAGIRTRIWLEGKRLIAAGFTPGKVYTAAWGKNDLVLSLDRDAKPLPYTEHTDERLVSGRETGKPIIDIAGARVFATFGDRESVTVTYSDGVIHIQKAG